MNSSNVHPSALIHVKKVLRRVFRTAEMKHTEINAATVIRQRIIGCLTI